MKTKKPKTFHSHKFVRCDFLEHWYRIYNKRYFGGKLHSVEVGYSNQLPWKNTKRCEHRTYGWTLTKVDENRPSVIVLQGRLHEAAEMNLITLLHEMIHVKIPNAHHGPRFKKEKRRLLLAGAFDDLI